MLVRSALAPACLLAALTAAAPAAAEPVRLTSGTTLEAEVLAVKGDVVVLRLTLGGSTGTAGIPMARIEPLDLLRILGARTPQDDAPGQMRLARVAVRAGLWSDALARAARAATLDPTLAPERAGVMAAVREA